MEDLSDRYGLRARLEGFAAELTAERVEALARALTFTGGDEVDRVRAVDTANSLIQHAIMAAAKNEARLFL